MAELQRSGFLSYSCCTSVFNTGGSHFSGKCHRRQIKHERCRGIVRDTCWHKASERAKEQRETNTHTDHKKQMSRNVTSLPASMVSFSLFPSSEPEATMALSMSPVARWQTQYFSASRGACREKEKWWITFLIITTNQTNEEKVRLWILTLFYLPIPSESQTTICVVVAEIIYRYLTADAPTLTFIGVQAKPGSTDASIRF